MKEVGHRTGEDTETLACCSGRPVPGRGLSPRRGGSLWSGERLIPRPTHDGTDVTVSACLGHLVTTPPRVPGVVGPAYLGILHTA
jgi:hypothetical protein